CVVKSENCVSLDGIRNETVQGLVSFFLTTKCNISLIGGTEAPGSESKYSYKDGFKVDMELNPCLEKYVTTNLTFIGNQQNEDMDPLYVACSSNLFTKRKDRISAAFYIDG
ncbi:hypothetical protein K493DRAFT_137253, partial [Basidiobolus meristosporus CBS 931.73]